MGKDFHLSGRPGSLFGAHRGSVRTHEGDDLIAPAHDAFCKQEANGKLRVVARRPHRNGNSRETRFAVNRPLNSNLERFLDAVANLF